MARWTAWPGCARRSTGCRPISPARSGATRSISAATEASSCDWCVRQRSRVFLDRMQRAWSALVGAAGPSLRVRTVPDIPYKTAGNEFEDFTSDFMADRAVGADAAPR